MLCKHLKYWTEKELERGGLYYVGAQFVKHTLSRARGSLGACHLPTKSSGILFKLFTHDPNT